MNSLRFSSTSAAAAPPPVKVKVTFIDGRKKTRTVCEAPIGKTLLTVGIDNRQEIEAACDGTCACSTCHVYIDEEHFAKLPKASDDEEDMLDLAIQRKETSRLCCQITVTAECDGMERTLPTEVSNQFAG